MLLGILGIVVFSDATDAWQKPRLKKFFNASLDKTVLIITNANVGGNNTF